MAAIKFHSLCYKLEKLLLRVCWCSTAVDDVIEHKEKPMENKTEKENEDDSSWVDV